MVFFLVFSRNGQSFFHYFAPWQSFCGSNVPEVFLIFIKSDLREKLNQELDTTDRDNSEIHKLHSCKK